MSRQIAQAKAIMREMVLAASGGAGHAEAIGRVFNKVLADEDLTRLFVQEGLERMLDNLLVFILDYGIEIDLEPDETQTAE